MTKRQEELFDKLLDMGIVPIFDEVNTTMLERVQQCFMSFFLKRVQNITVLISSNGGNLTSALEIVDMLKIYPGVKTGIVIGRAKSSAAIILQACDKRLATPHSQILIHNGTAKFEVDCLYDDKKLANFLKKGRESEKKILKILTDRTKKSEQETIDMSMKDESMSAEEALEFGLIDEIFTGQLPFDLPKELTNVS
jgi:ATP-dependent Clp protease protease subunit